MVDDLTPQDTFEATPSEPAIDAPVVADASGGGFFSTTAGKVTIIAIALFAILLVAGIALGAFFLFFASEAVDDMQSGVAGSTTATGTASAETTEGALSEPGPVALTNIYTFRNIFEPLIGEPVEETVVVEGEEEIPEVGQSILFLQDIEVIDGVPHAVLIWNDSQSKLKVGEMITGTPWQVLSIGTESVTMLYGDEQVVLIVGQGIVATVPPPVNK